MNNGIERVRAKMRVHRIIITRGSCLDEDGKTWVSCQHRTVELGAVMGGSPENNNYAQATPSGKAELSLQVPSTVAFFEHDHDYYVDFTPAKSVEDEKLESTSLS